MCRVARLQLLWFVVASIAVGAAAATTTTTPGSAIEITGLTFVRGQMARRAAGVPDVPALRCRAGDCDTEVAAVYCECAQPCASGGASASEWTCGVIVATPRLGYSYRLAEVDIECDRAHPSAPDTLLDHSCAAHYNLYARPSAPL